jgi:hypothetical protein
MARSSSRLLRSPGAPNGRCSRDPYQDRGQRQCADRGRQDRCRNGRPCDREQHLPIDRQAASPSADVARTCESDAQLGLINLDSYRKPEDGVPLSRAVPTRLAGYPSIRGRRGEDDDRAQSGTLWHHARMPHSGLELRVGSDPQPKSSMRRRSTAYSCH